MKGITKEKKIIITVLITAVLMLTIAFASLSSVLKINGTAKVDSALWDIHFKSASMINKKGDAREVEAPVIENGGIDLTLKVGLRKPKDEITYEAVIVNAGDMDAQIERIDYPELTEDQAKILEFEATYDTGMTLLENQSLKAKEEIKIEITVRFKDITDETLLKSEAYDIPLTFKINYIQSGLGAPAIDRNAESILAQGKDIGATSKFFNGPITKESVEKIKFMPTTAVPSDAIGYWDASYNKDNSVIAWYTDDDSNDLYELYIGGYGKVYAHENSGHLFHNFIKVTEIDFGDVFDTSKVTTMQQMFNRNSSLTSLDLSNFDTSKVTDMSFMFSNCLSLTSIDIGSFNTSNVTGMTSMFSGCSKLIGLNVSNFDTSNVTGMDAMFASCSSLTNLDLSSFNTSNVTNMSGMFQGCTSILNLDISSFDTENVTSMNDLFRNCGLIEKLDLSHFNVKKVTNMWGMFRNCSSLTSLNMSSFDTSKVKSMSYMFSSCSSLTELDLSSFNTSNVTDMTGMFFGCSSLISIDLSNFNTSNVTSMREMFAICSSLISIDLSSFNTSKVTDVHGMFRYCSKLESLDLRNSDFASVTDFKNIFNGISLKEVNLCNITSDKYSNSNFQGVLMLVPSSSTIYVKDSDCVTLGQSINANLNYIVYEA